VKLQPLFHTWHLPSHQNTQQPTTHTNTTLTGNYRPHPRTE
jgi:hypothetical protein